MNGKAVRIALSAWLGLAAVRLLGMTWRITRHNDAGWRALRAAGKNYVMAVWHGEMLPAIWAHRGEGMVALVSEHSDGEIIARVIAGIGFGASRGSTTRGGARALLTLIRALESGLTAAFTPDGPRGPRHELQPGLLAAAKRAGVPIVLIGVAVNRYWQFRSWDQFLLPKPFARVSLAYSNPAVVDPDAVDVSAEVPRFAAVMTSCEAAALRELARG